jgi:alkylation response protein AidB-like acyl-CoA dehydrogenase
LSAGPPAPSSPARTIGRTSATKLFCTRTLYDDVRLLRLYEGTSEIQRRLIVGSGLVRGN